MPARQAIPLVVGREIRSRILSRPFLIGLATTVVMLFGVFGVISVIDRDDPTRIGLLGGQPAGATEAVQALADIDDTEIEFVTVDDRAEAETAVLDGDLDVVVVDGAELVMERTRPSLVALLTPAYGQARLVGALDDAGLDQAQIGQALGSAGELSVTELEADPERDNREGVAVATVVLLFIAVQISGAYIMLGVFEEKSSKVVELVLSSIKARDLLAGKIIGIGALGLLQVVVLAASALAASAIFGSSVLSTITPGLLVASVAWFLLGYLLYGATFAAGASLAPRQEDAQSTLAPVSIIMLLSYVAATITASSPDSLLSRVLGWIPFVAPFAMPGRIAAGEALWWEVGGAMVITAIAAVLVIGAAARIYVRSVIHTERTLSWREAWTLTS
ncbi:MAG: ABC transporter permease [Actinomycetota bacterium]